MGSRKGRGARVGRICPWAGWEEDGGGVPAPASSLFPKPRPSQQGGALVFLTVADTQFSSWVL